MIVVASGGIRFYDLGDRADPGGGRFPTNRTNGNVAGAAVVLLPQGGYAVYLDDGRVRTIDDEGEVTSSVGTQMTVPSGLDAAPDGTRYVAASADGLMIGSIDGSGLIARGLPRGPGTELTVSPDGTLVVSTEIEAGNNTLWRVGRDSLEPYLLDPEFAEFPTYLEPHPDGVLLGQLRLGEGVSGSRGLLDRGDGRGYGSGDRPLCGSARILGRWVHGCAGLPGRGRGVRFRCGNRRSDSAAQHLVVPGLPARHLQDPGHRLQRRWLDGHLH